MINVHYLLLKRFKKSMIYKKNLTRPYLRLKQVDNSYFGYEKNKMV